MSGYHRNTAVLDACVLYPAPLRDLLLSLAAGGMFAARWTEQIQEEWIRNLTAKRPELDSARLRRTANLMCEAVEDCLIDNFEHLINSLTLPDPDDRHVMAAAIAGNADVIVTFNQKDFPKKYMRHHGIKILHPDDFIVAQFNHDPVKVLHIIKTLRGRLTKPAVTALSLVSTYERQDLPKTAGLLRNAITLI